MMREKEHTSENIPEIVKKAIGSIRERLGRIKPSDLDFSKFYDSGKSIPGLRSETLVGLEEIQLLQSKIDALRNLLIESMCWNGLGGYYWRDEDELIEIGADGSDYRVDEDDRPLKLYSEETPGGMISDEAIDPSIYFYFDNTFIFGFGMYFVEIGKTGDKEHKRYIYDSGAEPLDKITEEEYMIIAYCLERYINKIKSDFQMGMM